MVAIVVRWTALWFSSVEVKEDIYSTDYSELHEAISGARKLIWIHQTWLPGVEHHGQRCVDSEASELRVCLASFQCEVDESKETFDVSSVFARVRSRRLKVSSAKTLVANSVKPFCTAPAKKGRQIELKFNPNHHPGWIVVADSSVFWGPTPSARDNQTVDFLFERDSIRGAKGGFWLSEFEHLWSQSHSYEVEKRLYNAELP